MDAGGARARVRFLDHTADLGIVVEAASLGELFAAAALGLADVVVDAARVEARETRRLELEAADRERLLVKLLREVLYLYEVHRWLVGEAEVELLEGNRLVATLRGETMVPERHVVRREVKAVTYHALAVTATEGGSRAQVVLDL